MIVNKKSLVLVIVLILMAILSNLKPVFAEEIQIESVFEKELVVKEDTILILKGEVEGDNKQVKRDLSLRILKRLSLDNWLNDSTLKTDVKFANIYGNEGEEMMVTLSLPKDNGLLAIFVQSGSGYQLELVIKGMLPITGLNFIEIPDLKYKAIVVDEYLDERFGAFFESKSKSIYIIDKDLAIKKVWERVSYLKVAKPLEEGWLINLEEVDISFNSKGKIIIRGKKRELKVENLEQSEGQEISSLDIQELYLWKQDRLLFKEVKSP
ncbi:hypothetical protein U472_07985 [Orenia metallireducens]|uniref:Uncharacterized protein n=1 Tax=Orenia metallireducens TaxID=1413210 RepID=A0A1C0AAR1_9FIRM|nr:hypothetical protein [Orenia metallireducens]OCL27388.1 hypothetical protein U472_07985 [Orenia metallireducens]